MNSIVHEGRQITYRKLGQGDKTLVLVHGWMVSGAVYTELAERLDLDQWQLLIPDLRGTGESACADDYTLKGYVEDLRLVVDDAGAQKFCLVGHSMGGQIAQLFAATYPDRVEKLALLCTVPASGMELPQEAQDLFYNSGENREMQAAILGMACLDIAEPALEKLLDDAETISAECIQKSFQAWTGGGFVDELAKITAPTLVVGSDDPFLPPEFLKAAVVEPIAQAHFAHVPGAGHYVQVERAAETAELLQRFFSH